MHILIIGTLLILLLIAMWQDTRHFRIPNKLVYPGTVIGILLHVLLPEEMDGFGILTSLAGLGVGLIVLLPLYLLRAMGAGDIKLMAMVGAFVGPSGMLSVTLYVLLAGGILAMSAVLVKRKFSNLLDNLRIMFMLRLARSSIASLTTPDTRPQSVGKLPYGVAIAAGTFVYLATIQ